jgi:hypothetical protein
MVTALGQRVAEQEDKRQQSLLAEINARLDELARATSNPDLKQAWRASRTTNTGGRRSSRKVVDMSAEPAKTNLQAAEDRE